MGRVPAVSQGQGWGAQESPEAPSGWLLTAAYGLRPAPGPVALALPLRRPSQHQIGGAAVADFVPKAKAGPRPHGAYRDARVRAVASCEATGGDGGEQGRPSSAFLPCAPTLPSSSSPDPSSLCRPFGLPLGRHHDQGCGWKILNRAECLELSALGRQLKRPSANPGTQPASIPKPQGDADRGAQHRHREYWHFMNHNEASLHTLQDG